MVSLQRSSGELPGVDSTICAHTWDPGAVVEKPRDGSEPLSHGCCGGCRDSARNVFSACLSHLTMRS